MTALELAPKTRCNVGRSEPRRNAAKLLRGQGRYLADHDVAGLHHIAVGRSTVAHARVRGMDVSAARSSPGVVAVVTQADLDRAGARRFSHLLDAPAQALRWGVLASDRVRFVGEPVVAVVARTRAEAEDALELVEIDYEELAPVVGAEAALAEGAPLLYEEWGTNEFLHLERSTEGFEAAMAAAPRRFSDRYESHRVCGLPLEGHGAQAEWDRAAGRLTLISSTQQPHQLRSVVAEVCGLDEAAVRVVSPDMGGGFGNKQHFSREECLVGMLARITGLAVRWSQDRTEALVASVHARAQVHDVEVGFDEGGRVLALRVRLISDLGNPVLYFSGAGPALVSASSLTGGYAIPHLAWELSCVATSTCPVGAYRGFGQPEAHLTTERIMDRVAAELGFDPLHVRRVNLLPDTPRPWWGPGGQRIDAGPLGALVDRLADDFDYLERCRARDRARGEGRFVGIGISTLVQGTAPTQSDTAGRFGSIEMAMISVLPDARIEVRVGTKSQGQAHETVFAQVAADALGVDIARVVVRDGDTDALPFGQGTWGSRSAVMGGGAVRTCARRVRERMAAIASALGLDLADDGPVPDSVLERIAAVAWWHPELLPPGMEPGLTATAVYTPGRTGRGADGGANHDETYSSAASAVVVEVDPVTGRIVVLEALLVSDCGRVINPAVVEGQLRGGFAQGLGTVLMEEILYDDAGQPLCSTLADYLIPTASDVPDLRVVHRPTPSDTEGGFRGVGESSIIVAPAVLVSAVSDALSPLGVWLTTTRLQASYLRGVIRAAGWKADPARWAEQDREHPGEPWEG